MPYTKDSIAVGTLFPTNVSTPIHKSNPLGLLRERRSRCVPPFIYGTLLKPRKVAIETGSTVEWMEEECYKFRLSSYREPLINWLSGNELCKSHQMHSGVTTVNIVFQLFIPRVSGAS